MDYFDASMRLNIKKIMAATAALLIINTAFAQQQNFVELTIADSLHIEADEIIYRIKAERDWETVDSTYIDSSVNQPVAHTQKPDALLQVRQIITEMGIDTVVNSDVIIVSNARYRRDAFITMKFISAEKFRKFVKRIAPLENILGVITRVASAREPEETKRLFQRIVQKAKQQAAALAQISGKKLGNIVSIQEEEIAAGWTSYPPLSGIPGWHAEPETAQEEKIVLQRRLVVRFQWQ